METREHVTHRIILPSLTRSTHQRDWPEIEVTRQVTVLNFETWGVTSVTHEIVVRGVIDIRNGLTREALDDAHRRAHHRADRWVEALEAGHPRKGR